MANQTDSHVDRARSVKEVVGEQGTWALWEALGDQRRAEAQAGEAREAGGRGSPPESTGCLRHAAGRPLHVQGPLQGPQRALGPIPGEEAPASWNRPRGSTGVPPPLTRIVVRSPDCLAEAFGTSPRASHMPGPTADAPEDSPTPQTPSLPSLSATSIHRVVPLRRGHP